jgi:tRNA-dihydrouridine synthase B
MPRRAFPFPLAPDVPLYLAPMAGVSESPFRQLCREHGADVVVTEFLSAEGIRREIEATISKLRFQPAERPIGVQIFGAEPAAMGEAAAFVTDVFQPEFIDINFGCPVKKVVRRNGGSGCLKDLGLVEDVIRAVVRSTSLPVTVKIRSGWSEEMRDPVTIALLGNGDIKTPADAVRMHRETGCTGVMIARGSYGQPWIFAQTRAMLEGKPVPPDPTVEERFAVALHHARLAANYEIDARGAAIEFRKHLGWYAKGLPGSAELRKKLHAVTSLGEVEGIFADYLAHRERYLDGAAPSSEAAELEVAEA